MCATPFLYRQPGRYLRWREYSFGALLEPVVKAFGLEGTLRLRRKRPQRRWLHWGPRWSNQAFRERCRANTTEHIEEWWE